MAGDPWEGVWTNPCSSQVRSSDHAEFKTRKVREFIAKALVSCWHENERDSAAMWKLCVSGRDGVALKTTVGKLGCALVTRKPTIGRAAYKDSEYQPTISDIEGITYAGWFLFRKTPAYWHEQEIRAVLLR